MTAPRIYYYDDPNAPVWTGLNGFYEMLNACLVTGYGSKPGAGWSVVYDDFVNSGNVSFTNAARSGVLGLWHPRTSYTTYQPMVYVAEAMTDKQRPVKGRCGSVAVSDTASLSFTTSNYHHVGFSLTAGQTVPWVLMASENFALLFYARAGGSAAESTLFATPQTLLNSSSYTGPVMLGFGAIRHEAGLGEITPLTGNFIVLGGVTANYGYPPGFTNGLMCSCIYDSQLQPTTRYNALFLPYLQTYAPEDLYSVALLPVDLLLSSGSSYNSSQHLGKVPGLFAPFGMFSLPTQAQVTKYTRNVASFRDVLTIDGRQFLYGLINQNHPVYVCLDASAWL